MRYLHVECMPRRSQRKEKGKTDRKVKEDIGEPRKALAHTHLGLIWAIKPHSIIAERPPRILSEL